VYLRHNIFAIQDDRFAPRRTQSDVQDGPPLRDIYFVASKHSVDAGSQDGLLRQLQQELQRLAGDAVLGVIKVDTDGFRSEALATLWVIREELSQVQFPHLGEMGLKSLPCCPLREWRKGCRHARFTSSDCLSFECHLQLGETETIPSLRSYYHLFPAVFLSPKTLTLTALKRQWVLERRE
jgi:hypothetical protein